MTNKENLRNKTHTSFLLNEMLDFLQGALFNFQRRDEASDAATI